MANINQYPMESKAFLKSYPMTDFELSYECQKFIKCFTICKLHMVQYSALYQSIKHESK